MTPEQLKASILQYAIQGKLVKQRTEDGIARELLEQIKVERKNYKINEFEIETIDEVPFDIPETWEWVRLQDVVKKTIKRGKSPKYIEKSDIQVFAQKCNVKTGGINMNLALHLDDAMIEKYPAEEFMCNGDIVINSTGGGTMGRVGIFHDADRIDNMRIVPDGHVTVIRACTSVNYKYLYYFIKCNQKFLETQGEGSTNQTELKPITIASLLFPLPPFEEQNRIVAKIEELLPLVDRYAEAYEKLENFNAKFPEDMKKSILQYAIQGKLVEQRAEEGTAEELWEQIKEERKNYKIKEFEVDTIDEMPFDIPDTWRWVRLQDIVKKTIKRGKSPKYADRSDFQVFAQKCNVKTGGINMNLALFLDDAVVEKYPTEEFMCNGDIVINSTGGGTMGRVGIFHDTDRVDNMRIVPDGHVTVIRACDSIDYKYLYYFIKHNQKYLETQGEGSTNQTELKPITIASLLLPLPPLEEQHRIVKLIEELLPYCDRLISKE